MNFRIDPRKKSLLEKIILIAEVDFTSVFFMPESFKREEIVNQPLTRSIAFRADDKLDKENRTIELSFSSDAPVRHYFGHVILDHSEGSARLERINNGGALLWAHDRTQQIGGVSDVRLDTDKGRALVKFSRGAMGEEKFQDVQDGICQTVSFGFYIYNLDPEPGAGGKQMQIDGEYVYRSRDWEPFEISLEPIPADTSVGVGRSLEKPEVKNPEIENREFNTEKIMAKENEKPAATPEETERGLPVQSTEVSRAAEFQSFGAVFGEEELARDLALDGTKTLADLRQAIADKRKAAQPIVPPASTESVAARNGAGNVVELARSVYRGGPLKSFKGEKALENAYRAGMSLLAQLRGDTEAIEFCRNQGIVLGRTQTGKDNAKGGVFVIPEVESAIIDLRILYGAFRANANVSPMNSDTKIVHRRTGGLTAYPVGPGQAGTKSTATWDDIELVARKWMVLAKIESELEEDSVISFADTLVSEIAYAFTYAEDNAGINGDGTSAYHGIVGVLPKLTAATAGLKTASGNAWSEITREDMLGVVALLPQFARKSGNVKWYCSHEFWANVMERIALAAGGVTHAEIAGELKEVFFGKPVEILETMPHTEANSQVPVFYGNLMQAATMGDRRGVQIKMTDSNDTDFEKDLESIKGTERFDINVHDVGNTTTAGPIVGLITAGS